MSEKIALIEIVDHSGETLDQTDVAIPFFIRITAESDINKYKIDLIDEKGFSRGYYIGTHDRNILDLEIPLTKVPIPSFLKIKGEISTENGHEVVERKFRYLKDS